MTVQPVQPIVAGDIVVPSSNTPMDKFFFDNRFMLLANAINGLIAQNAQFAGTEDTLVAAALDRLNAAWAPLLTQLQNQVELGFLVAQAVTTPPAGAVQLANDTDVGWIITNPPNTSGQSLFTPTTYVLAVDDFDPNNWGIIKVTTWTESTNNLAGHCIYCTETKASNSWTISCNAAILQVMMDLEAQTQNYATQVANQYANVLTAIQQINQLVAQINQGPVTSVCGYQGIVVLGINDITGLAAALASKASIAALNTVANAAQPLSNNLTSLAGLNLAANNLIYAQAAGILGSTPLSPFTRTLLGQIDQPSWQFALGITVLGRSIVGAPDQATALSVIGALDVNAKAGATEIAAGTDNTKYATCATITQQTANLAPRAMLVNDQVTTFYTFQAIDVGYLVRLTANGPIAAILPNNLPAGWNCLVEQGGNGQITFQPQGGTTVTNRLAQFRSAGQYAVVSLYVRANPTGTNAIYNLTGDTSL